MNSMKLAVILIGLALASSHSFGQSDLQSQIRSVGQAQEQIRQDEDARKAQLIAEQKEKERLRTGQQREKDLRALEIESKRIDAVQEIEKKRIDTAQAAAKEQAALVREKQAKDEKERQRNRAYEDEIRRLDLVERKADLATKRARADRANDYIDKELSREDAKTDVIQSGADANRNIGEGARELMKGIGKGAETAK